MARYEREFVGIPAEFAEPRGLDPNYRRGYSGMRMTGGAGRAAYGMHRQESRDDLEEAGGYGGIHGPHESSPVPGPPREGDESGGLRDPFYDQEFIREFNAHSPMLDADGRLPRRRREDIVADHLAREPRWMPRLDYRPEYSNRGLNRAGYSEGWARRRS